MASYDLPTPPKPTRATRAAGLEHRWLIWSRMSSRLTKSVLREKGMVAKGVGGVSCLSRILTLAGHPISWHSGAPVTLSGGGGWNSIDL